MVILRPQRFTSQPQYAAPLNKGHWLAKDLTFSLNAAVPSFNAATGQALAITAGGSGFSRRATPLGTSLYTPDGGWADVAVGQDWVGPNTVIMLCRVNAIDASYGGVFSKDSSGTNTQFAVGRDASTSSLYGAVENATAVSFGGGSIPSLVDFGVLVFTHSGASSSAMSYYRNGVLQGVSGALGAQNSGTGVLGLGRSRDALAAYDSDVDWVGIHRAKRVLSDVEIAEISRNFWAPFQAPARRLWFISAATGSAALTGQALTSAQGTLAPSTTVALSGQPLTSSQGSLSPNTGVALTGQSLTSSQGSVVPNTSVALTGQSAASAQGTLSANGSVTLALSGQSLTSSQGTLVPSATGQSITIALTGQSLTSAQGSLSLDQYIWDTTQGTAQPGRGTFKPLKPDEMSKPEIVVVDIPEEESTYEHHPVSDVKPTRIGPRAGISGIKLPPKRQPTTTLAPAQNRDYKALMARAGKPQKTMKLSDFPITKNKKYLTKTRGPVTLKGN